MYHYHADYKERVEIGHLVHSPPVVAVEWLRTSWSAPRGEVTNYESAGDGRKLIEYLLSRRNDPLVNHAIARYGVILPMIQRAYDRGDASTKFAALANPRGGARLRQADQILASGKGSMVRAMLQNPHLPGEFIERLLEREDVDESRRMLIVYALTGNARLSQDYDRAYLDGYAEYSHGRVFSAAWELSKTVSPTQQWASILWGLLERTNKATGFKEIDGALARWRIDEEKEKPPTWYNRSYSFNVRSLIADYLKADSALLNSEDAALRMSFYRRFSPYHYRDWPNFLERDGAEFINAALENLDLWRDEEERERLSQACWDCPDPHHSMNAPNDFRSKQRRLRTQFPGWFRGENDAPPPPEGAGAAVLDELKEIAGRVDRARGANRPYWPGSKRTLDASSRDFRLAMDAASVGHRGI